ncbi:FHA domain-containing protein [Actinosynnema sp. NPDC020468]|uniref:FHA domain-containing protein n=1 Tax=Actinosynnema sp. NPDC020468 TaxID=3154488 RepID=UPI0033CADA5C
MIGYRPGPGVAVVAEGTWLLLAVPPEAEIVGRCWDLIRAGAGVDEVLSEIVQEGLRSVGSFALARYTTEHRRLVVRGSVVVRVDGYEVRADEVAQWLDLAVVEGVREFTLSTGEADGAELPLERGVARAGHLVVRLEKQDLPKGFSPSPPQTAQPTSPPIPHPAPHPTPTPHPTSPPIPHPTSPPTSPPFPQPTPSPSRQFEAPKPPRPAPPAESPTTVVDPDFNRPPPNETALRRRPGAEDLSAPTGKAKVRSTKCPVGHLNPDHAISCRICGQYIEPQDPMIVPRPPLGVLRLSTGELIPLDRGVILGRDPQVSDRGPNRPHVVKIQGNDISRNHVEVRLEGWDVHVVDLGSKNGTSILVPGWSPQDLAGLIPALLAPGARVMLGDGAFFTYEVA